MSTISLRQPCMEYKIKFDASKMEKVKIKQSYDDGTSKERKCPVFTGKEGIEGLLYVEEKFRKLAKYLGYDTGMEYFENFEEVVTEKS